MELALLPSFKPITRVGVFCRTRVRSVLFALDVHRRPEFLVDFAMTSSFLDHASLATASTKAGKRTQEEASTVFSDVQDEYPLNKYD